MTLYIYIYINKWNTKITFLSRLWNNIVSNETPRNGVFLEKPMDYSSYQQMHQLLWNLKVYNCVHENPQLEPIICEMNPAHNLSVSLRYTLILSFHLCLGLQNGLFSTKIACAYLTFQTRYTFRLCHPPLFDHSNISGRVNIIKFLIKQTFPLSWHLSRVQKFCARFSDT
jgi:hypothetical protein